MHADVSLDTSALEGQNFELEDRDLSDLAVWIDPIDATSQYIKGGQGLEEEGVPTKGLPVVTVLLGAFLKSSGQPVLGVVNQPFATAGGGRHHWAVQTSGGADLKKNEEKKVVLQEKAGSTRLLFLQRRRPTKEKHRFSLSARRSRRRFWKGSQAT